MKVSELTGATLDYWVGRTYNLDGLRLESRAATYIVHQLGMNVRIPFSPSTDWAVGGPIIEKAAIGWRNATPQPQVGAHKGLTSVDGQPWEAWFSDEGPEGGNVVHQHVQVGATMLEACMRAYVASKFGEEVPDAV